MHDPRKGPSEARAEAAVAGESLPAGALAAADPHTQHRLLCEAERVGQVGSWTWDVRAGTLDWSDELRRILGVGTEVRPSKGSFLAAVHPDDRARLQGLTERALRERWTSYQAQFRVLSPDGVARTCRASVEIVFAADGTPTRVLGTTHDVTDRVAAEAELHAARAEAERARAAAEVAARAKDEFLAVVSHGLRTPLAAARALAQLLAGDARLTPEHRETAAEIEQYIALEARLIDDVLDFERAMRGALSIRPAPTDLHDQVRRAIAGCAVDVRRKRLTVVERLDAADAVVWADPVRLWQVVWSLVQNAAQFTRVGDRITLSTTNSEPGVLALEVKDTGVGIPPEALERIFDGFRAPRGGVGAHDGLGLGLAMSRRIAELHGGTLTATSEGRARGATLALRLPTAAHRSPDASSGVTGGQRTATAEPLRVTSLDTGRYPARSLHILLLEDHEGTARALVRLLESHDHTVRHADTVAEAERAAAAEAFDLYLCDLQLPDGTGVDFLSHVRARSGRRGEGETAAIALSGYDRESDVERCQEAGFAIHLAKPVEEQDLLAAIRLATARRAERDAG
jgi:PAS domain S-box-containing protein